MIYNINFNLLMFASLMSFRLVQGQLSCFTPGGERGQCISVLNCPPLVTIINKKDRTQQDIDFLRKSKCGYVGNTPKVCCPGPQCKTPDGNHGTCVGVHSCPHLAAMVKQSISKEDVQYLQNSICDGPEQYSVCCGPLKEETQVGNCKNRMNALPPDPRTECCGLRSGNKIIRGTEAAIDEYPWLALIEYEKDGVIKALCNGALISGKYVLTPGHCVVGPILNVGTPKNIRLGEYDTVNDGRDCINIEGGGMDCTDPPVVIPVELIILHPQIELNSRKNDIALIRMRQNAPFTDFIQPICLPTLDVTASRSDEDRYLPLITAGWRTFNNGDHSTNNIQHIFVPFVNNTECAQAYSSLKQNITLWNKQLCSGGENNMKTCNAPIEGPLMYNDGRKYEIVGVENFAPRHCGVENIPKMYTKVYEYITWIHNAITP